MCFRPNWFSVITRVRIDAQSPRRSWRGEAVFLRTNGMPPSNMKDRDTCLQTKLYRMHLPKQSGTIHAKRGRRQEGPLSRIM